MVLLCWRSRTRFDKKKVKPPKPESKGGFFDRDLISPCRDKCSLVEIEFQLFQGLIRLYPACNCC